MARPRSVSDAQLLAATERVVARLGPRRFTLADVGKEAGLSAPAVLKRFESKRALLLALAAATRAQIPATFARRPGEAALAALVRALVEQTRGLRTPREVVHGLEFLELDVGDAEFRALAVGFFASLREAIRALLDEAVDERELRRCDTEALARAVEIAFHGAIVSWGVRQEGKCEDAVARDVEMALAPYARGGRLAALVRS